MTELTFCTLQAATGRMKVGAKSAGLELKIYYKVWTKGLTDRSGT